MVRDPRNYPMRLLLRLQMKLENSLPSNMQISGVALRLANVSAGDVVGRCSGGVSSGDRNQETGAVGEGVIFGHRRRSMCQ